jgi:hypothetical protein
MNAEVIRVTISKDSYSITPKKETVLSGNCAQCCPPWESCEECPDAISEVCPIEDIGQLDLFALQHFRSL